MKLELNQLDLSTQLLQLALGERDPGAMAARVATYLASKFGTPLLGISYHSGDRDGTAVASSLPLEETKRQARQFFSEGLPADAMILRTLEADRPGLAPSRWTRLGTPSLTVFWLGGAGGLEAFLDVVGQTLASVFSTSLEIQALERLATTDPLTEIPNRRGFTEMLEHEIARASRNLTPMSLVMLDLDDFKQINDRQGHSEGDRVLRGVAAAVRCCIRGADVAARLGGDEFVVMLPDTNAKDAERAAERMLQSIARVTSDGVPVRASLGIAAFGTDASSSEGLIDAADRALYASKNAGGARVTSGYRRVA